MAAGAGISSIPSSESFSKLAAALMLTLRVIADLERMLVEVGAVKQNDPRLRPKPDEDENLPAKTIKTGKTVQAGAAEDDEDWD